MIDKSSNNSIKYIDWDLYLVLLFREIETGQLLRSRVVCPTHRSMFFLKTDSMFRFCAIANLHGEVKFSHYFESVLCAVTNLERDVVQDCLKTGEKEGVIKRSDCLAAYKREGLLCIVIGAVPTANANIASDLLHAFAFILTHHLKTKTEMQTVHNKEVIHKILGQMVHGSMLETRISHITALHEFQSHGDDGN
uniref:Uncharacterized protein n=1 Tax=Daphnia galeata TaxID=27404 RepID=A0A8J2WNA5_9CRUS|nr:unnamed protein product [Daphnia galeata]